MDPKPTPEYPTAQQIDESFKAYKQDGTKGILEHLKEQRRKREAEGPPGK
jgi:hypothetical protein